MKRRLYGLAVTLLFGIMLLFPKTVFQGAADGLLLWYQVLFPTLFPFMVIGGLLLSSGGLNFISRIFGPFLCPFFRVSEHGAFAVLAGFLCGYPMGAKITADLIKNRLITKEEGTYLISFCNNTSPVFLCNFILWKGFHSKYPVLPSLLILFLAPVLVSLITRRMYRKQETGVRAVRNYTRPEPEKAPFFPVLETCIIDSFDAIVKVGMYVVLFSILIRLFGLLPGENLVLLLTAPLELSNGVLLLCRALKPDMAYILVLALASFGGLCAAAQTGSMLKGTRLSMIPYLIEKLAAALATSLLAWLYLTFR